MGAENILPVKGRKVEIEGKEYTLQFTMRTIAELAKKYGTVNGVFEKFAPMIDGSVTFEALESLADLVSAGLRVNHPEVTAEFVMDNFDIGDINDMTEDLLAALMEVMSSGKSAEAGKKSPQKA